MQTNDGVIYRSCCGRIVEANNTIFIGWSPNILFPTPTVSNSSPTLTATKTIMQPITSHGYSDRNRKQTKDMARNEDVIWKAYTEIKQKTKTKMARKKASKYKQFSAPTQSFMEAVEKFIVKKYGNIEPHWDGQLQLLATNYDLFSLATEQVRQDGLMITNRFGGREKHPMLRQITDSNIQCVKLIHEFGLSPSALGKIKDTNDEENEIIGDFLK